MKILSTILVFALYLFSDLSFALTRNEEKLGKYMYYWNKLAPGQAKLQFAGSMGMFSLGPGWYYGKRNQWETDLFIGFIPRIDDIKGHITTTLKQTYAPFRLNLNDAFTYEPLTCGAYINKLFGPYFWSKLPDKYPKNYYFWATNTRFHIFIGQAISFRLGNQLPGNNLSFFYELNTNDLYVISAIGNEVIKITDIVNLSLGVRYRVH